PRTAYACRARSQPARPRPAAADRTGPSPPAHHRSDQRGDRPPCGLRQCGDPARARAPRPANLRRVGQPVNRGVACTGLAAARAALAPCTPALDPPENPVFVVLLDPGVVVDVVDVVDVDVVVVVLGNGLTSGRGCG